MAFYGLPKGITDPPRPLLKEPGAEAQQEEGKRPVGTLVLVGVFLAAFILYYFVNWKLLSDVWQIG